MVLFFSYFFYFLILISLLIFLFNPNHYRRSLSTRVRNMKNGMVETAFLQCKCTWIQRDCSSQLSRDSSVHLWKGEAHATMPEGGIDKLLVR
jgi:hypothetical protein